MPGFDTGQYIGFLLAGQFFPISPNRISKVGFFRDGSRFARPRLVSHCGRHDTGKHEYIFISCLTAPQKPSFTAQAPAHLIYQR